MLICYWHISRKYFQSQNTYKEGLLEEKPAGHTELHLPLTSVLLLWFSYAQEVFADLHLVIPLFIKMLQSIHRIDFQAKFQCFKQDNDIFLSIYI